VTGENHISSKKDSAICYFIGKVTK